MQRRGVLVAGGIAGPACPSRPPAALPAGYRAARALDAGAAAAMPVPKKVAESENWRVSRALAYRCSRVVENTFDKFTFLMQAPDQQRR